jgi:hypothetical protein
MSDVGGVKGLSGRESKRRRRVQGASKQKKKTRVQETPNGTTAFGEGEAAN